VQEVQRFNYQYATKLVENYRAHKRLLKLYSRLFYARLLLVAFTQCARTHSCGMQDGELQAKQDVVYASSLANWPGLPRKGYPLMFKGVIGKGTHTHTHICFFPLI
jgi:helicase MOV-10